MSRVKDTPKHNASDEGREICDLVWSEIGQREMSYANAEKKQGSLMGDAGRLPGGGVAETGSGNFLKILKQRIELCSGHP